MPASTLTNVGITGNGRAFEYLLSILFGSNLKEEQILASQIKAELDSTIKSFVRRSDDKYGKELQKYLKAIQNTASNLAKKYAPKDKSKGSLVRLVDYQPESDALDKIVSAALYEQSPGTPYYKILDTVKKIDSREKNKIISSFANIRKNRRHRPPRAFEMSEYTFDLVTNFGMFRDFHRHRVLTIERQLLTTDHGFAVPREITTLGIEKEFKDCMYKAKEVFDSIRKKLPEQAQYVVNFAYNYPYFIHLNLREACHLIELRTVPQGHIDYRTVAQSMYKQINKVHPTLSKIFKFVDLKKYELERFESEKRTEEKRKKLDKK